jgi:entry exclusion lipoprotein TrbK
MKRLCATFVTLLTLAAAVAGCNSKAESPAKAADMPQVNQENCKTDNVKKLDADVRQQFADACFKRGTFKPSKPVAW